MNKRLDDGTIYRTSKNPFRNQTEKRKVNSAIVISTNGFIKSDVLEEFRKTLLKQKEEGIILLPPYFEYVTGLDEDCDVVVIQKTDDKQTFIKKHMSIPVDLNSKNKKKYRKCFIL